MLNKNETYYENTITGEITNDKWTANYWAEINKVNIVYWRWSNILGEWLDFMVREA